VRCIEKRPFFVPGDPAGKNSKRGPKKAHASLIHHWSLPSAARVPCFWPVSGLALWVIATRVFRLPILVDSGWVKNC